MPMPYMQYEEPSFVFLVFSLHFVTPYSLPSIAAAVSPIPRKTMPAQLQEVQYAGITPPLKRVKLAMKGKAHPINR